MEVSMSNRRDITDGLFATTRKNGLIYTKKLGWIDLGHAQGNDARALKTKLDNESFAEYFEEFDEWYYPVSYHQEMGKNGKILDRKIAFRTGVSTQVMVKACLSPEAKARVALTIMYNTAKRFEAWQNSILFSWYTDSGYSAEDLVSDLVGFYRVFGTGPDPLWLAEPVSYETALQIWDSYDPIGRYKNTQFSRLLFPTEPPKKYGHPIKKELPSWLNYIKPLDHEYHDFFINNFRDRPVKNFFNDPMRINHELYSSFSSASEINYSDDPFERPVYFLLNPHQPYSGWKL
jgi:hypothetical protein